VSYSVSANEHFTNHFKDYSIWLTTYGRRTNKPRMVQIWFAYVNDNFYILSRHGLESWWAKNLLKNNKVIVNLAGRAFYGVARFIEDDDLTREVWRYYRGKYRFYPQTYFSWKRKKLFQIEFDQSKN
jgi:deazaflavin-dependent oxidoreductase (nitroreductase family)